MKIFEVNKNVFQKNRISISNKRDKKILIFLVERKLRITNIKLKIAIKLKDTGFKVIFWRFEVKH